VDGSDRTTGEERRVASERLSIGEVGRRAGLEPSAIRYYERLGLLPRPARAGGKRRYDESVLDWLALIALARAAGFTMAEIGELVAGFPPGTPPAERWAALAARKLAELDALAARVARMREVLRTALACGCLRLEDCGHLLERPPAGGPAR
jgi:MerR family transcriptional regulator, redox-sensitive transcriptional activator SoxR